MVLASVLYAMAVADNNHRTDAAKALYIVKRACLL